MGGIEQPIYYFEEAGYGNTSDVVEIAYKRLQEGDIESVVVASSSGETGLKFAKKMAHDINLVVVSSHPGFSAPGVWNFNLGILKELEAMGCKVVKQSHILSGLERSISNKFSGASHTEVLAEAIRSLLGVGMKVAIECTIMAADCGAIPIQKTIAVEEPIQEKEAERIVPLWFGPPTLTISSTFGFSRFWQNLTGEILPNSVSAPPSEWTGTG